MTTGPGRTSPGSRRRPASAASSAPRPPADPETCCASCSSPASPPPRRSIPCSGRGYGLSVAADAARQLSGQRPPGAARDPAGTALIFSLPLSAARRSLLLVEAAGRSYALPGGPSSASCACGAANCRSRLVGRSCGSARETRRRATAVTDLAAILGQVADPADPGTLTAVVLRTGGGSLVLAVDRLHDVRPFLVLPAPDFGADPGLIAGTAVLHGDVPVLVLDPEGSRRAPGPGCRAVRSERWRRLHVRRPRLAARRPRDDPGRQTTRSPPGLWRRASWKPPATAWSSASMDRTPSTGCAPRSSPWIWSSPDVEMPRLDGFGLLKALRADERFARLPTILMTSAGTPPTSPGAWISAPTPT
ncbi:hypothetical protein ACU4GA_00095 [Methylobacterium oryzae CBMB20]